MQQELKFRAEYLKIMDVEAVYPSMDITCVVVACMQSFFCFQH